jgi:hypothetical protein
MGIARGTVSMFMTLDSGDVVNLGAAQETGTAWIRTKALCFERDNFVKYLERVITNIEGRQDNETIYLKIYGSDDEEGPLELLDTIWMSDEEPGYTDPDGKRYFWLEYGDTGITERWSIHGIEIFGELGGEEF